jgi:hypothetical protein
MIDVFEASHMMAIPLHNASHALGLAPSIRSLWLQIEQGELTRPQSRVRLLELMR